MSSPITITYRVDAEAVQARFGALGPRVRQRVRQAVLEQATLVQRLAKQKLSGPVLKNRTGRLRRSINVRTTDTAGGGIVAQIGTNVPYAAIHEYGFDGTERVRGHLRTVTQAFGRPIAPVRALVRSHDRHVHMPQRSFLRSALAERVPSIREALRRAVEEAVAL